MSQDYYAQPVAQSVPVSQDEMYAHIIQEERVKNIIAQISPENQLYEIEMRIKGYRKNFEKKKWEKIDPNAPEVSPLLVSRFVAYLSSLINTNTSISNLQDIQINRIMKLVIEYTVDDINSNAKIYGLESNYTERTRICHIIWNSVFMVLNRALNGQEAKRMWSSLSMNESNSAMGQPQKKGGFFSFLNIARP